MDRDRVDLRRELIPEHGAWESPLLGFAAEAAHGQHREDHLSSASLDPPDGNVESGQVAVEPLRARWNGLLGGTSQFLDGLQGHFIRSTIDVRVSVSINHRV